MHTHSSTQARPADQPRVIWSVQAAHLDEAEFMLEMFSDGLDSPKYTLDKLARGPERRFLARVDALLAGRERVLEGLVLPVLDRPDRYEFRTAAATFTILASANPRASEQLLVALGEAQSAAGQRGLVRGLSLSQTRGLIPWLARDLDQATGAALVGRLEVLAAHRVDAGARLIPWLHADELEVRRAAARLARHTADPQVLHHLAPLMTSEDHELRWAALDSGLARGLTGAWERVCAEACAPCSDAHQRRALSWLAMLGDHGVHQRLLTAARSPSPDLLWAAGLTGRAGAVDLAMELLDHPRLARLAGEVTSAVAGLPTDDDRFWLDNGDTGAGPGDGLPSLEDDDLDADLVPLPESWLRAPNPDTVRTWWTQQRPHFEAGLRYSRGRVLDAAQLELDLRDQPTRRRHHRALELCARTAGAAQIETRSFCRVQAAQLDAARGHLGQLDCQRGLSFHA